MTTQPLAMPSCPHASRRRGAGGAASEVAGNDWPGFEQKGAPPLVPSQRGPSYPPTTGSGSAPRAGMSVSLDEAPKEGAPSNAVPESTTAAISGD